MSTLLHIPAEDGFPRSLVISSRTAFVEVPVRDGATVQVARKLEFIAGVPLQVPDGDVKWLLAMRSRINGHKQAIFQEGEPDPRRSRNRDQKVEAEIRQLQSQLASLTATVGGKPARSVLADAPQAPVPENGTAPENVLTPALPTNLGGSLQEVPPLPSWGAGRAVEDEDTAEATL
jgi:hypothetical protein